MTNSELLEKFTEAMTHEGIEVFMSLWAPDGEHEIMATGEKFSGLDQIRQLTTRSVAARTHPGAEKKETGLLPFNIFSNVDGTKFIWEYIHKGVVTDQWPGSANKPKPGTAFELPIILMCEVKDGKLVRIREYFDLLTLIEAGTPHHLYS
jgi:ketosteroid isomerase-like protein